MALLAQGCGTLSDLDALKSDTATCGILGLERVSGSRRVGEWLHRMTASHVVSLRRVSQAVSQQVAPTVIAHEVATRGYVPVFLDGTAIEVDGDHFEGASRSCGERRQYWMHAALVGRLQVSGRLEPGTRDSVGDWSAQLSEDLGPLLGADESVRNSAYEQKSDLLVLS